MMRTASGLERDDDDFICYFAYAMQNASHAIHTTFEKVHLKSNNLISSDAIKGELRGELITCIHGKQSNLLANFTFM